MNARKVTLGLAVNLCRFAVALTFIFSGYVKAIDPLGTQYKLQDYLEALGMAGLGLKIMRVNAQGKLNFLELHGLLLFPRLFFAFVALEAVFAVIHDFADGRIGPYKRLRLFRRCGGAYQLGDFL